MMNRRDLIVKGGQLVAAASILPSVSMAAEAGTKRFELALSQYSLRALLKDGSLKAIDFPAFTADTFGIKAIDLWEGGLPKDKLDDKAYLTQMKEKAAKAGTELYLLMTGALESNPKRFEKSFNRLLPSIGRAQTLGCQFLRVFLKAHDLEFFC